MFSTSTKLYDFWPNVVGGVTTICKAYQMNPLSAEVAVHLFNRFVCLGGPFRRGSETQCVVLACVLLAAKSTRREISVPNTAKLARRFNITQSQLHTMEFRVFKALGWCCYVPTVQHFLSIYLSKGIVVRQDFVKGRVADAETCRIVAERTREIAHLCLLNYAFLRFQPSILSTAIVFCTRKLLGFREPWIPYLAQITGYGEGQEEFNSVLDVAEALFDLAKRHLEITVPVDSPEDLSEAAYLQDGVEGRRSDPLLRLRYPRSSSNLLLSSVVTNGATASRKRKYRDEE